MIGGRAATDTLVQGRHAISVNDPKGELPLGWTRAYLTDVADMGTGHTPSRNQPSYWDGGIPWIGIKDAREHHGGVINDTIQQVSELGLQNSAARLLPTGTVCLSRTASVGYVIQLGREMATSQDFVTWTCGEALSPEFLMRALLAEGEGLRDFGEGSTHTTIYFPALKAFTVALPPITEQHRIVAKLDVLTARLARARAEISKAADNQRRLKAVCYEAAIATDAGEQTLACVLTDVRYGTAQKCGYDGATPVLRIPNVAHGEIDFSDLKSANFEPKEIKALSLAVGDVLIVRSNGSLELVGRSALVDEKAAGMLYAGYLIRLRLDPTKALPTYVQLWLSAPSTRAVIEGLARSSSGVNNINSKQLQALRIRLPDLETQKAKVATAMAVFARADRLEAEAKKALALIDRLEAAILARAFRGELVPQDPNDEPASVLLERIRDRRAAEPTPKRGRRPKLAS